MLNNRFNNQYENPFDPQRNYHETSGIPRFSPETSFSPPQPDTPRKKSKAPKYVAIALAMILTSAAAGGGAAAVVLNSSGALEPASTVITQQVADASSPIVNTDSGSVTAVVNSAANSVVEITTKVQTQGNLFMQGAVAEGAGSGVIISPDGYIVTNNHVVDGASSISVSTKDGTEYEAKLIGTDSRTDVAVIKIEASNLSAVTFADSDNVQAGDLAVAIGNPLGTLGGTVTNGIISATNREITVEGETMNLFQTSAAVNSGNSGGGLFDASGNLIGIVNAKTSGVGVEGIGFAIPSNTVKEVANELINNGYVSGRPQLGIKIVEINDAYTASMYGVTNAGVYIADPGNNKNLEQADRIVFADGKAVQSSTDLSNALKEHSVGETISLTLERKGAQIVAEIVLQEQVPDTESSPL